MSPIQLRPLDVIVLFNHVEGVWEGLDQATLERHEATLGKLMANFATEKDAKMVFFTPQVAARTSIQMVFLHTDSDVTSTRNCPQ